MINAYYHDGGLSDSKIVDLIIQDCEKSKEIKEKVKAEGSAVKINAVTPLVPIEQPAATPTTSILFTGTSEYITSLIILNIVILGFIIFAVGSFFIKK